MINVDKVVNTVVTLVFGIIFGTLLYLWLAV